MGGLGILGGKSKGVELEGWYVTPWEDFSVNSLGMEGACPTLTSECAAPDIYDGGGPCACGRLALKSKDGSPLGIRGAEAPVEKVGRVVVIG